MKLLLDTHVFLWYIAGDVRLPRPMRDAIQDPANDAFLSAASLWEAVIKFDLGKLSLPFPPATFLPEQRKAHGIAGLSIDEGAMQHLATLPPLHRDPFDRLLVAQSLQHDLTLVTVDTQLDRYPMKRFI